MLALAYRDLYHLNPLEARRLLLRVFQDIDQNISQTARILSCMAATSVGSLPNFPWPYCLFQRYRRLDEMLCLRQI